MRHSLVLSTLAGLTLAMPHPQAIDLVSVSKAPKPVIINPAIDTAVNSDLYSPDDGSDTKKRSLEKRDGDCSKQPDGAGPVASPDTSAAFLASSDLQVHALRLPPKNQSLIFVRAKPITRPFLMATQRRSPISKAPSVPPATWAMRA